MTNRPGRAPFSHAYVFVTFTAYVGMLWGKP